MSPYQPSGLPTHLPALTALPSQAQQEFDRLTQRIAQLESEVAAFRQAATQLRQRVQQEYRPLQAEHNRLRAELVRLLDYAHDHQKLSKTERGNLANLVGQACADLPGKGYPELRPLIDKYAPPPTPAQIRAARQASVEQLKRALEQRFGIEFDPAVVLDTPQQVRAYLAQLLAEQAAEVDALRRERQLRRDRRRQQARQLPPGAPPPLPEASPTKTVRTLYLELVKHLHPDREIDEAEKIRKTALLQRITAAYAAGELLTLLRLQHELGGSNSAALADDQLRHYNQLLQAQARELEQALAAERHELRSFTGRTYQTTPTAAILGRDYEQQHQRLAARIQQLAADLHTYEHDPAALRAFLKGIKLPGTGPLSVRL